MVEFSLQRILWCTVLIYILVPVLQLTKRMGFGIILNEGTDTYSTQYDVHCALRIISCASIVLLKGVHQILLIPIRKLVLLTTLQRRRLDDKEEKHT